MSAPCAECGRISRSSPSDYFCSDQCQQYWHARRTVGYPSPPELSLPRSIGTVARRWRATN